MPIPTLELSPFQHLFLLPCSYYTDFFVPFNFSWSFSAFQRLLLFIKRLLLFCSLFSLFCSSFSLPCSSSIVFYRSFRLSCSSYAPLPLFLLDIQLLQDTFSLAFSSSNLSCSLSTSSALYSVSLALILLLFRLSFVLSNFSWSLLAVPALYLLSCSKSNVFISLFIISCSSSASFRLSLLFSFSGSLLAFPALHLLSCTSVLLLFIQPLLLCFCSTSAFPSCYSASLGHFQPFLLFIQTLLHFINLFCFSFRHSCSSPSLSCFHFVCSSKKLFLLSISLVFLSCSCPYSYSFLLYCTVQYYIVPSSLDHRPVFISDLSFLLSSFYFQFVYLMSLIKKVDRTHAYVNVKLLKSIFQILCKGHEELI